MSKYLNYLKSLEKEPTTNLVERADQLNINHNVSIAIRNGEIPQVDYKKGIGYYWNKWFGKPNKIDAEILREQANKYSK